MEAETEYYGLYALKNLLEWPALRLVLHRRKRIGSARTVVLSGAAQTGKTIALHLLPPRLPAFKVLLVATFLEHWPLGTICAIPETNGTRSPS